jgi:hypothetical protein
MISLKVLFVPAEVRSSLPTRRAQMATETEPGHMPEQKVIEKSDKE